MTNQCKVCSSQNLKSLYEVDGLPLFQNKVFDSVEEAENQKQVDINLTQCVDCGFVFNSLFSHDEMEYDDTYNNEQNYSGAFVDHLNYVADFLISKGFKDKNVVEIGCGKGYFTELLEAKGFNNIFGFDPAYEGDNPNITKDYFGEKYKSINADLIVLRHVLEHIDTPYEFLKLIKSAVSEHTKILIEVPDFDWIVKNKAFWDVFYEHCNYFNKEFLKSFFDNFYVENVFGGQYLLQLGDLSSLKQPSSSIAYSSSLFEASLSKIKDLLRDTKDLVVWGAASKGVTLLNIFDKQRKNVSYCIDINPKKQNKFVAITGHKIYSPEALVGVKNAGRGKILIVNQNYFDEIVKNYSDTNIEFLSLEELIKLD